MMMNLQPIKQHYWKALARYHNWRRPHHLTLSPGDPLDAITAAMPAGLDEVVYVDGGAHDGAFALNVARRLPNLKVHAFEPNTDLHATLRRNLADLPGSTVNAQALGAGRGPIPFHVNASPMTSSALPRARYAEEYFDAVTQPRLTRQIELTTLDAWASQHGIDRVDILKLDLQGYEGQALLGAHDLLRRGVRCVYLEVHFIPFYTGSALFADVDHMLRAAGYRLHNLYNLATHLPEGQLGSADALYIFDAPTTTLPANRPHAA